MIICSNRQYRAKWQIYVRYFRFIRTYYCHLYKMSVDNEIILKQWWNKQKMIKKCMILITVLKDKCLEHDTHDDIAIWFIRQWMEWVGYLPIRYTGINLENERCRCNKGWLYPLNAERLARKQPVPILTPLVWCGRVSNPWPTNEHFDHSASQPVQKTSWTFCVVSPKCNSTSNPHHGE